MKIKSIVTGSALAWLALLAINLQPFTACAQGTAFTYQGRLNDNGNPAAGDYNLTFTLFSVSVGGVAASRTVTNSAVNITNGLFTVQIDFGPGAFTGATTNWLQIGVATNGSSSFTPLTPRQELTPTPYAIFAGNVSAAGINGTIPTSSLIGTYGNAVTFSNAGNSFSGYGGGLTGINAAAVDGLTASNFWQTAGNAGTSPANGNFIGTTDNQPLELRVDGQRALRLEPSLTNGAPNVIGGSSANFVSPGVVGAVIGGGATIFSNVVTGNFGSVNGGAQNTAADDAVVSGGASNTAGSGATVSGGSNNTARGLNAVVSGGYLNTVSGVRSGIGSGLKNDVTGNFAVIAGGFTNLIYGDDSAIVGGEGNAIGTDTDHSFIGGGLDNSMLITNGGSANVIGGGENNSFIGSDLYDSVISGGNGNQIGGNSATVGGGEDNQAINTGSTVGGGSGNLASGRSATVAGGGSLFEAIAAQAEPRFGSEGTGNTASGDFSSIGGGQNNVAGGYAATIAGGEENLAAGSDAAIGGGSNNNATNDDTTVGGGDLNSAGGDDSTVGGGQQNTAGGANTAVAGGNNNLAGGDNSFVGGGYNNLAYGASDVLAGGFNNSSGGGNNSTISGGNNNDSSGSQAVIGGGQENSVSGNFSTVGGGVNNVATNDTALVSGGTNNVSGGYAATVAGGSDNAALGDYSFAAGNFAQATNNGAFVWADASGYTFVSTTNNQFSARATGGVRFVTAVDGSGQPTAGVSLAPGDTSWAVISDRNVKKDFAPVNTETVLNKLATVPIEQWHYKWEADNGTPNIGPMAQDFIHAFYPGRNDKSITTLEFDGVELAAIQGLNQKLNEKDAEVHDLKQQNDSLEKRLNELEVEVKAIEQKK